MEQTFQTSFIPKKPMVEQKVQPESRPMGLLFIISIFIFLAMVLASGGVYLYKQILAKDLVKMKGDLELAENSFEPNKIIQLKTLDKRLAASKEILNSHVAISPIFKTLEESTLKNIRYTSFSYEFAEGKQTKMIISMSGVGVGYRSIALQAELLTKNKNIIDPVFSDLSLDEKGNVLFELSFSVDPSFVNYKEVLKGAAGGSLSLASENN